MRFGISLLLWLLDAASALSNIDDYLIHDPSDVARQNFDYIIVGGGPAGLTAAARLTENPAISVLLIESGFWETDRSASISNLTHYGHYFETAIDHQFTTRTQAVGGRALAIISGRGLGGSTLINGGAYTRPAKVQVDAWETVFGNEGWTWSELLPFMKRAESVRPPSLRQGAARQTFDPSCHGKEGPVHVGPLDTNGTYSPCIAAFMDSAKELGIPTGHDLSCGNPRGVSTFPVTVTAEGERSDAGRAWLLPAIARPNLKVLVGQWVGKILFDTSRDIPVATGVEYGHNKGRLYQSHAKFEILLAAGALVSPLILEHSGIGPSHVLQAAGVDQIVELPVGLNLQDQSSNHIQNSVHEDGVGQGQAAYFVTFNETFADYAPTAFAMLSNKTLIREWAEQTVTGGGFHDVDALLVQYDNHIDHIQKHNIAYAELLLDTWGELSFSIWNLLPFWRGYIHIRDGDPYLRKVDNNPRFLSNEFDVLGQAAAAKLAREWAKKGSMARHWKQELNPGIDVVPTDANIHTWAEWVKSSYHANLHAVGTCSMMKRSLGGVVDYKAQVYGTKGLRVIDASIIPTQISSHMVATIYGVAEKIVASVLDDYDAAQVVDRLRDEL